MSESLKARTERRLRDWWLDQQRPFSLTEAHFTASIMSAMTALLLILTLSPFWSQSFVFVFVLLFGLLAMGYAVAGERLRREGAQ